MSMPSEFFGTETFTINDVDMLCPAWIVLDLANLWVPTVLYDNRVAPGLTGQTALEGVQDELRTSLPFRMTGAVDHLGNAHPDPVTGFRRNWVYLCQNVFLPPTAPAHTALYQSPDAYEEPFEFDIQVATPVIGDRYRTMWEGTLPVILPGGALVLPGAAS